MGTPTAVRLEAARKAEAAARMRVQRYSWSEIAAAVGYKYPAGAATAVKRHFDRIPAEATEELRRLELAGLDRAERALQPGIEAGDVKSVHAMIACKVHRARLTGLFDSAAQQQDAGEMAVVQIVMEAVRIVRGHPELSSAEVVRELVTIAEPKGMGK